MKKLLVATTNPGKFSEIKKFLADISITCVSLEDLGITHFVEESGKTFEENARIKSGFYQKKSGVTTLADDGGFEIDALGGEPGIKSHRWIHGDRDDTDEELIAHTIKRLKGVPLQERGAQLRLVLALALPDGSIHTTGALIRGVIPLKPSPSRTPGFPFRSLLFIPQISKFYNSDDLTTEENEVYNHRKRALEKLKPVIIGALC